MSFGRQQRYKRNIETDVEVLAANTSDFHCRNWAHWQRNDLARMSHCHISLHVYPYGKEIRLTVHCYKFVALHLYLYSEISVRDNNNVYVYVCVCIACGKCDISFTLCYRVI